MAKLFSWSYSKVKNYVTCPKRHYEVDIQKHFNDTSEALTWGNEVHDAFKVALSNPAALMPDTMKDYQKWVDELKTGKVTGPEPWLQHLAHPDHKMVVEQKYAITKDFQPCGWSEWNRAWYRGICDVAVFDPTVTVGLARDWKTGAVKHDSRQLMLMAQCLFAHFPTLRKVKTEFVWIKEDCITPEVFDRATIAREWPPVLEIVQEMERASKTLTYPPKPSGLCRSYCPVVSCPFYKKGR